MTQQDRGNFVRVVQDNDEWVVIVKDDNGSGEERFQLEKHAQSFAAGQRLRLRLPDSDQDS